MLYKCYTHDLVQWSCDMHHDSINNHMMYQQMVTSHDSNSDVYFTLMLPLYLVASDCAGGVLEDLSQACNQL